MSELQNPLPKSHYVDVCKIGQGNDCCRYIVAGAGGIECTKHSSLKQQIDARAYAGSMVAISDNCEGVLNPGF